MKSTGFTLIEMLIVVALTAIILMLAAPSLNFTSTTASLDAMSKSIDKDIALARSQALSSGRYVTMCLTNASNECATSELEGQIIFIDMNSDGVYDSGTDKTIAKNLLNNSKFTVTPSQTSFSFTPMGKPTSAGTISLCPNDTSITQGYEITLLLTGAHTLTTKTC